MRVYDVMSKAVETVTNGGSVEGVISERDLGGPKLPKLLGKWTVADLMTSPVVTVTTRTPIRRAATLMRGRSIGSLVVTAENGKVAGIVTVSDLLDLLRLKPERRSNRAVRKTRGQGGRDGVDG